VLEHECWLRSLRAVLGQDRARSLARGSCDSGWSTQVLCEHNVDRTYCCWHCAVPERMVPAAGAPAPASALTSAIATANAPQQCPRERLRQGASLRCLEFHTNRVSTRRWLIWRTAGAWSTQSLCWCADSPAARCCERHWHALAHAYCRRRQFTPTSVQLHLVHPGTHYW
jgi:hypothetical protein